MLLEEKRKKIQDELDSQKKSKERNQLGQFSTPYNLALEIMKYVRKCINRESVSFIEPSIGMGAFYSAFNQVFKKNKDKVLGFEIDEHYYIPAKEFWKGFPITLKKADFLTQKPKNKFDLLVANPPYVRHHHIHSEKKQKLQEIVFQETGVKLSGLAGLYCYFLMISTKWLKKGGLSCWLIPSEFMDVNYGEGVKKYLLQEVDLLQIHRFRADDLQFDDALVTSCIVVFRNNKPTKKHDVLFTIGNSINNPQKETRYSCDDLHPEIKWTGLFENAELQVNNDTTLGDFFDVKRGIATGKNSFFIIDKKVIEEYCIPQEFLFPILPGPRFVRGNRISKDLSESLVKKELFLFSCDLSEDVLKKRFPKLWKYIQKGIKMQANTGYICQHRTPWYNCEIRKPASFIVPYMGRSGSNNEIFRFILNETDAIVTNGYLMLYPKQKYMKKMNQENIRLAVWEKLNSISKEIIERKGRFYGGGLQKIEPKELLNIPADSIKSLLVD